MSSAYDKEVRRLADTRKKSAQRRQQRAKKRRGQPPKRKDWNKPR